MILELQTAQGQWSEGENDNEWVIVNRNGDEIDRIPASLSDFDAMRVIRFGRKFEMKAFEDGVAEGLRRGSDASKANRAMAQQEIAFLKGQVSMLEEANARLAIALDEEITKDTD